MHDIKRLLGQTFLPMHTGIFVLAILSCALTLCAQPKPSSGQEINMEKFNELKLKLNAAEMRLNRLEAEAHADNPELKKCEDEEKAVRNWFDHEQWDSRNKVYEYLNKKDAVNAFMQLRTEAFAMSVTRAIHEERYESQLHYLFTKSDVFRNYISNLCERGGLPLVSDESTDMDAFWLKAKDHLLSAEPKFIADFDKSARDSGFPDYVVTQAKNDAYGQMLIEFVTSPCVGIMTPAAVHEARKEVGNLKIEMAKVWPDWLRLELEAQKTIQDITTDRAQ